MYRQSQRRVDGRVGAVCQSDPAGGRDALELNMYYVAADMEQDSSPSKTCTST